MMDQLSLIDTLTTDEAQQFEYHEAIVERGVQASEEAKQSLRTIQEKRLYRAQYRNWAQYCHHRWGFSPQYAHNLIGAEKLEETLSTTVDEIPIRLPENEWQARPLTQLEPDQQREAWEEAVRTAPDGKVTGAHVEQVVKARVYARQEQGNGVVKCAECKQLYDGSNIEYCPYCAYTLEERIAYLRGERTGASQQVQVTIFSSESNEYYTPPKYIEAARAVMGHIDLDPASCEAAQENVKANRFYSETDNGLIQEWHGVVWLNPPYGTTAGESNQGIWAQKLIREYLEGRTTEAILLVKAALGYNWFEDLWYDWPVCLARERLSFIKADGSSDGQSKQGTAFFYFGLNFERFVAVFDKFGRVIMPENMGKWQNIVETIQQTAN